MENIVNIIPNFLEQEKIDLILRKYEDSKGKSAFEINEMGRWAENLYAGNFGPVYIISLYNELLPYLQERFKAIPEFAEHTKVSACFLHIWQPGSGINWHHDSLEDNHRIGFTVYLNPTWNVNWGGLFLWEKNHQTGWICPQYNMAVWLQSPLWHSVSLITRAASTPRLSLQIFLEK